MPVFGCPGCWQDPPPGHPTSSLAVIGRKKGSMEDLHERTQPPGLEFFCIFLRSPQKTPQINAMQFFNVFQKVCHFAENDFLSILASPNCKNFIATQPGEGGSPAGSCSLEKRYWRAGWWSSGVWLMKFPEAPYGIAHSNPPPGVESSTSPDEGLASVSKFFSPIPATTQGLQRDASLGWLLKGCTPRHPQGGAPNAFREPCRPITPIPPGGAGAILF